MLLGDRHALNSNMEQKIFYRANTSHADTPLKRVKLDALRGKCLGQVFSNAGLPHRSLDLRDSLTCIDARAGDEPAGCSDGAHRGDLNARAAP